MNLVENRAVENHVVDAASNPVVSLDELGSRIVALAGRLAAATCRWLLLVAEFDARDGCAPWGLASTAAWLEHACGLSHRTATDHVRVARALAAWPQLAQEMSAGRLSYSHARAISRVADLGGAKLVQELIMLAAHGTVAQLEVAVRGLRSVADNEQPQPEEYTRHGWTNESQWRLSARLDPERGELVASALAGIAKAEGVSPADALVRLAEIGLAALSAGGDLGGLRGEERAAVVIHLDAARVSQPSAESQAQARPDRPRGSAESRTPAAEPAAAGSAEPAPDPARAEHAPPNDPAGRRPYARIADGPGLPDAVVERLLCNGRIRTVVHESPDQAGGPDNVLDLGRSHRLVTDKQYRALMLRHQGRCGHPGCRSRRNLQAHHVRHWLHGGRTDLANLVLLCERHHHEHHDGHLTIVPIGVGRFRYLRDGRDLSEHADVGPSSADVEPVEHDHPHVAATAATTRWDGSRLDHDYTVHVLAQHLSVPA